MNLFKSKKHVVIYYDSTKSDHGYEALEAFYEGLKKDNSIKVTLHKGFDIINSDVAVFFGYIKPNMSPQKRLLFDAYTKQTNENKKTIVMESALLNRDVFKSTNVWRVGWNGFMYDTADFCNKNCTSDRWEKKQKDWNIKIKPWKKHGTYILMPLQTPKDASLKGINIDTWAFKTVHEIRKYTDRPIRIRYHPKTREGVPHDWAFMDLISELYPNISIDDANMSYSTPEKALKDAWATVSFTSGFAVDSIIEGIPTFIGNTGNMAFPVSEWDLSKIEEPRYPDRTQFLSDLSYCQWDLSEMRSGECWDHLKIRLDDPLQIDEKREHPLNDMHPIDEIFEQRKLKSKAKKSKRKTNG